MMGPTAPKPASLKHLGRNFHYSHHFPLYMPRAPARSARPHGHGAPQTTWCGDMRSAHAWADFSRHGGLVGRLEAIATSHAAGAMWHAFGAHSPNHTSEKGGLRAQRGTKHVTTAHKRRVKKMVSPPEPPKPVSSWLCPRRTFCVVCVCVVVC